MFSKTRIITQLGALVAIFGLAGVPSVWASSFNEVRERVYRQPLNELPTYQIPLAQILTQAVLSLTGPLIDRAKSTLSSHSDFKPAAPKLLHPLGVCAEAAWKIHTPSFATGLLGMGKDGRGTEVPAIVRLSLATAQAVYQPGAKRNFAAAIKLFPAQDPNQSVLTKNIFTLDQTGLTGDERHSFFFGDGVYFTNDVAGKGFLAWLGQQTFMKLDPPSDFRALYPLAEIQSDGTSVEKPLAPRLIRFYPKMTPKAGPISPDFRLEILRYRAHEIKFDIVLPAQYGLAQDLTIGTLELGQPVLSSVCDLELTFHHAPENRALENRK